MNQTHEVVDEKGKDKDKKVTVEVNNRPVVLPDEEVSGLEVKQAAIAQGVEIELDFILTLEAEHGHGAEIIDDDRKIKVDKKSRFTCNDGEDDS